MNNFAPIKQKCTRGNHMPFMTKALPKEIMARSKLRNNLSKIRTEENKTRHTKQRNKCVSLSRSAEKKY